MDGLTQVTVEQTQVEDEAVKLPQDNNSSNQASELILTENDMAVWTWMVSKGITNALSGLSQMVGNEVKVNSLNLERLPAKDALDLMGTPETITVGIYLTIHGDANGHLLLMHDPGIAFQLVDLQLGLPFGTTQKLEKMERSVLGEMGNIAGTFFLNALADSTNLVLMPSPPAVIVDMMGAIMNIPLAFIMTEQDEALLVKAAFSTDSRQIAGTFMVLPTLDFMRVILKKSATPYARGQ
jgi:chemotaxis protein CheC